MCCSSHSAQKPCFSKESVQPAWQGTRPCTRWDDVWNELKLKCQSFHFFPKNLWKIRCVSIWDFYFILPSKLLNSIYLNVWPAWSRFLIGLRRPILKSQVRNTTECNDKSKASQVSELFQLYVWGYIGTEHHRSHSYLSHTHVNRE